MYLISKLYATRKDTTQDMQKIFLMFNSCPIHPLGSGDSRPGRLELLGLKPLLCNITGRKGGLRTSF